MGSAALMRFLNAKERELWQRAQPLLAKGRAWDLEHIKVCLDYTERILAEERLPQTLRTVLVPAVILHDIGWAFLRQDQKAGNAFSQVSSRRAHMRFGAEKAEVILRETGYTEDDISLITWMVAEHDNPDIGEAFTCWATPYLRDIDLLWRITSVNFWKDVKCKEPISFLRELRSGLEQEGFITSTARTMVGESLARLEIEIESTLCRQEVEP